MNTIFEQVRLLFDFVRVNGYDINADKSELQNMPRNMLTVYENAQYMATTQGSSEANHYFETNIWSFVPKPDDCPAKLTTRQYYVLIAICDYLCTLPIGQYTFDNLRVAQHSGINQKAIHFDVVQMIRLDFLTGMSYGTMQLSHEALTLPRIGEYGNLRRFQA